MLAVTCMLSLLFAVRCLMLGDCCLLCVCLLFVHCNVLAVVYCVLLVVCCALFAVCYLLCCLRTFVVRCVFVD